MASQTWARLFAHPARTAAVFTFLVGALPLAFGLVPVGLDFTRIEVPMLCELQSAIATGAQLWLSPHLGNGGPLFAHPHAQLLYPFRWLVVVFSPEVGASLAALMQLAVAAAGAAALARTFGVRRMTAASAGVTYALSGVVLDLIQHASYLAGGAWLPVAWAGARTLLSSSTRHATRRARALLATSLGVAAMLLGGEPQSVVVLIAILAAESVAHVVRLRRRQRAGAIVVVAEVAVAGIAGSLMGLVLWLPALAEMGLGRRLAGALTAHEIFYNSFDVALWPALVVPRLIIEVGHDMVTYFSIMGRDVAFVWNTSPFVASAVLTGVAAAALVPRARLAVLLALFFFLLAAGDLTPLLPALVELAPPLGAFRYPAKYLVPFALVATMAAAVALDAVTHRRDVRFVFTGGLAALALALASFVVVALAAPQLFDDVVGPGVHTPYVGELPLYSSVVARLFSIATLATLVPLVVALMPRLRPALAPVVALVTVALAPLAVHLTEPVLDEPGVLDLLSIERADPVVYCPLRGMKLRHYSQDDEGFDHAASAISGFRYGMREAQACYGLASPIEYGPTETHVASMLDAVREKGGSHPLHEAVVSRALGCDRALTSDENDPPGFHSVDFSSLADVDARFIEGVRVVELDAPLPLAFVSPAAERLVGDDAVFAALMAARDPLTLVDVPLFRGAASNDELALPSGPPTVSGLRVERDGMDAITLFVDGHGPAVVGVRQSYRRGFTATQGERALPVVRVGGMFVGVVVDDVSAGPVLLTYRPPRLGAGLLVGALGLLTLVALFARVVRARTGDDAAPVRAG